MKSQLFGFTNTPLTSLLTIYKLFIRNATIFTLFIVYYNEQAYDFLLYKKNIRIKAIFKVLSSKIKKNYYKNFDNIIL